MGSSSEPLLELDATDILYEEDILRNAYSLKYWVRYIEAKKAAPARSGMSSPSVRSSTFPARTSSGGRTSRTASRR